MKYFTKEQIEEIRRQLATNGVRDMDLIMASVIQGDEYVAIVQDGINKKVPLDSLLAQYLNETTIQGLIHGQSAYELWLEEGHVGSPDDFLASLQGPQGERGPQGATGPAGPQGPQGPKGDPGSGSSYVLPAASSSQLGGVMTGHNDGNGKAGLKLDGTNRAYVDIPVATDSGLGGIKLGFTQSGNNYPVNLESGTHKDLLKEKGFYYQLYMSQFSGKAI